MEKNIYYYDIWDGSKGIIIADTYEQAKQVFKDEYDGAIPIYGEDTDDYDSGVCDIECVGTYHGNNELFVTE